MATGTGIAPMRGFAQWLFPEDWRPTAATAKRSGWSTAPATKPTSTIRKSSRRSPERKPNFHYLPTLSRALESWTGLRGYVQEHIARIVEERAARLGLPLPSSLRSTRHIPKAELSFDIYAYICGLNNMVSGVRERLAGYGWHKKQIVFERYD